jgi:hypothetical protein
MKEYWLKPEFFKVTIEPGFVFEFYYSKKYNCLYVSEEDIPFFERMQKCKLLRVMYAKTV